MAAYAQHYHYQEQPHFIDSQTFTFGHYEPREKTPTDSLLNHTGLSPVPFTATPPLSRNPSRQPDPSEDQQPDPLLWDNGSFSDSPTSVRTPDGDSFEVEMLDSESAMQNFYQQGGFNMSTQVGHNTIPAVDPSALFTPQGTFSNHAVDAAFNATMVSHAQQHFQQQYNGQSLQTHTFQTTQPQGHTFNSSYTTEPPRHDPWNGQGPTRSSMTPRSGGVIFDAVTDPVNYSDYLTDVWTRNYTDPNYMISPSEQTVPHDNMFHMAAQNLVHRPQIHIPQTGVHNLSRLEMQLTGASPSPDQHNFVNYNATSSLFTENYITGSQYSPSSPDHSSNGHFPQSPYQPNISPGAASPSSDDFLPHQHSDEMMLDALPTQQYHYAQPHPNTSLRVSYPSVKGKEIAFAPSPDSEPFQGGATMKITGKSSGGRQLGTHLEPNVAKAAHDMRKITACWHCVLQRDKCGPGDICDRCLKRSQRPNADCGLGCSRIKLVDLAHYFLPGLVTQMHEDSHLKHFVSQYIHQWGNVELTVYMTCGQHTMPRIPVKVYEFSPRGNELLVQLQYVTNPATKQREVVRKQSPALGMVHINQNEEKTYDKYISDIVDNHLDDFGELCWKEDDNNFLEKLFKLMTRVKPKSDDESKVLREVFRLVVVTFIMSHTLTMAEETKHTTLSRMHSYGGPTSYYENFTSPRMTNRQLKYFFSRLQKTIQTTVLNKLQQIFKSSKGCDKWLAAFVAVLGMCMALEDQQKTIHQVMSTRSATENTDPRDAQAQADIACQEIDTRAHFVQQIFRWKYNRKHNPLVNADHDWEKEAGFGDATSVNFVRQVAQLVKENTDFLQGQQRVSISCANSTKYSSRLVGQFLLSFWLPNA